MLLKLFRPGVFLKQEAAVAEVHDAPASVVHEEERNLGEGLDRSDQRAVPALVGEALYVQRGHGES